MNRKVCLQISAIAILSIILFILIKYYTNENMTACVFCDIVNKTTNTEILFENEDLIAFKDIKPASKFHFLIIPKKHIINTKALTINDKPMREKLEKRLN